MKPLAPLIDACLGALPLDILISGEIVDVYRGDIFKGYVGVKDGLIVYVGSKPKRARETIDNPSRYVLPAYIDGHIHIESSLMIPSTFAKAVIPRGTCCVIADPHEIANVIGLEGIKFMIEDAKKSPLKVYFMIPSCVPSTNLETSGAEVGLMEIKRLKRFKQVIGLGEVMNYWGVIKKDKNVLEKIKVCSGMIIDGHAPGLKGEELCAYTLAGILSDHEVTSIDEAEERLSLGMWIMIREGSTAKNLSELAGIISKGCPERSMLVTDDRHAGDILREGHMDYCLRRAVEEGIDPVDAVKMVTLKPADYFGLKNLGGLSPGKSADITIVNNLKEFKAAVVLINGKIAAKDGLYLEIGGSAASPKQASLRKTINIGAFKPEDLCIKYLGKRKGKVKVRVIGLIKDQIITDEIHCDMELVNGEVKSDIERDILKICVLERHKGTGRVGKGFVMGFGLKEGAFASTVAHDSHNIIAVGTNNEDLYKAITRLSEINGGLVVANRGRILEELPLPIAGLMTTEDASKISRKMESLEEEASKLGCKVKSPFSALSFLSLPVIPKLRITDYGLVDAERSKIVELFID
jgi:adenine deaminase